MMHLLRLKDKFFGIALMLSEPEMQMRTNEMAEVENA